MRRFLIGLIIILSMAGCSKSTAGAIPTTSIIAGMTSTPNSTNLPAAFPSLPAVTPTSNASPTPFTQFTVKPSVENLKLRSNAGVEFPALILLQPTDVLTVLGTSPGNEWTYVKTGDGTEGWCFSQLLDSSVDLTKIPIKQPEKVIAIKGKVVDGIGLPIQGVTFTVTQTGGSDNTVTTDENGDFYYFMPDSYTGSWTVKYAAIACKSNVWQDNACATYKAGYTGGVIPLEQTVTVPQSGVLSFTWH